MNQAVAQNVEAMAQMNPFDRHDDLAVPRLQRQIDIEALGDLRAGVAGDNQPQEVGPFEEEVKDEENHCGSADNVNAVMVECLNPALANSFAAGRQNLSASEKLQQRFGEQQPKLLTRHHYRKQRELQDRAEAEKGGKKEL